MFSASRNGARKPASPQTGTNRVPMSTGTARGILTKPLSTDETMLAAATELFSCTCFLPVKSQSASFSFDSKSMVQDHSPIQSNILICSRLTAVEASNDRPTKTSEARRACAEPQDDAVEEDSSGAEDADVDGVGDPERGAECSVF